MGSMCRRESTPTTMWRLQPRQVIQQWWRCGNGCFQKMGSLQIANEKSCKPTSESDQLSTFRTGQTFDWYLLQCDCTFNGTLPVSMYRDLCVCFWVCMILQASKQKQRRTSNSIG